MTTATLLLNLALSLWPQNYHDGVIRLPPCQTYSPAELDQRAVDLWKWAEICEWEDCEVT